MLGNRPELEFKTISSINGKSFEIKKFSNCIEILVMNPENSGHKVTKSFTHLENITQDNYLQILSADQQVLEFITKDHPAFDIPIID
jgi:hypothetical protein